MKGHKMMIKRTLRTRVFIVVAILLLTLSLFAGCVNQKNEQEVVASTEAAKGSESTESTEPVAVVNTIDAEKAIEMMASGDPYVLVDVRTKAEYDEGHIEGALLLPLDQLETLAESQLKDKNATLLIYCRSGNRSAQASALLLELGYTQIYDFGGIMDWPGDIVK
jgi:phage shock protein E